MLWKLTLIISLMYTHTHQKEPIYTGERIVGGRRVTIRDYPFMAGIVIEKMALQCGCSIIAPLWLITAAHCIELLEVQDITKNMVYISVGNTAWKSGSMHHVADWTAHTEYDNETYDNDIALIRVKKPFEGKLEQTIHIAPENYEYKPGANVTVIGWGVIESGSEESEALLNGVVIQILNQTHCNKLYDQSVTSNMFCAGVLEGGHDACQFDSGGPIFEGNVLIGIVSWGEECAMKDKPGVYTRVTKYIKWISEQTKKMKSPINLRTSTNVFSRRTYLQQEPLITHEKSNKSNILICSLQTIMIFAFILVIE